VKPLNESLYAMLQRAFKEVKIANEGQAFDARLTRNPINPDKLKLVGEFGEYYCVCCPWCKDKRFRLWINHRWGTRLRGRILRHTFVCYNEHCEEDPKFRQWLEEKLTPYVARGRQSQVAVSTGKKDGGTLKAISLPESTPLHLLPSNHPVLGWLRGRGCNPQELGEEFDVRWCDYSPRLPQFNKLIFPIYAEGKDDGQLHCYGFQARYFDPYSESGTPEDQGVKFYTAPGTKVTKMLYNGFRCAKSPIVAVGEGPFDATRLGQRMGVAVFGKGVSKTQENLLWRTWGTAGAIIVLAFDHDAWLSEKHGRSAEKLEELHRRMQGAWRAVVRLRFSAGEDPGSTPRKKLHSMIIGELEKKGKGLADEVKSYLST